MSDKAKLKPSWWPKNPYPESVFPMKEDEYLKIVPDEDTRTALSGMLGRRFWDMASDIFGGATTRTGGSVMGTTICMGCLMMQDGRCLTGGQDCPEAVVPKKKRKKGYARKKSVLPTKERCPDCKGKMVMVSLLYVVCPKCQGKLHLSGTKPEDTP